MLYCNLIPNVSKKCKKQNVLEFRFVKLIRKLQFSIKTIIHSFSIRLIEQAYNVKYVKKYFILLYYIKIFKKIVLLKNVLKLKLPTKY